MSVTKFASDMKSMMGFIEQLKKTDAGVATLGKTFNSAYTSVTNGLAIDSITFDEFSSVAGIDEEPDPVIEVEKPGEFGKWS